MQRTPVRQQGRDGGEVADNEQRWGEGEMINVCTGKSCGVRRVRSGLDLRVIPMYTSHHHSTCLRNLFLR